MMNNYTPYAQRPRHQLAYSATAVGERTERRCRNTIDLYHGGEGLNSEYSGNPRIRLFMRLSVLVF